MSLSIVEDHDSTEIAPYQVQWGKWVDRRSLAMSWSFTELLSQWDIIVVNGFLFVPCVVDSFLYSTGCFYFDINKQIALIYKRIGIVIWNILNALIKRINLNWHGNLVHVHVTIRLPSTCDCNDNPLTISVRPRLNKRSTTTTAVKEIRNYAFPVSVAERKPSR